jgi:hypothetical protein
MPPRAVPVKAAPAAILPANVPVSNALAGVKPVASRGGIKLNVYGRGKTGKTRLAATFPKPLLLIGTEDGTKSVANVPGIDFIRLKASADIDVLAELFESGKSYWERTKTGYTQLAAPVGSPYQTVGLDTAGGLQDIILKEILGLTDVPVQKSWGMAKREDWMVCGAQWKERMRKILDIPDRIDKNVVIIAHERNFKEEGDSDVMIPSVGAALTPTVAAWLNGACDYVCQAFIREQMTRTEAAPIEGAEKVVMMTPTGKFEYCLRIGPHPVYMTGFRHAVGIEVPEVLVNPSYDLIAKLIKGKP